MSPLPHCSAPMGWGLGSSHPAQNLWLGQVGIYFHLQPIFDISWPSPGGFSSPPAPRLGFAPGWGLWHVPQFPGMNNPVGKPSLCCHRGFSERTGRGFLHHRRFIQAENMPPGRATFGLRNPCWDYAGATTWRGCEEGSEPPPASLGLRGVHGNIGIWGE